MLYLLLWTVYGAIIGTASEWLYRSGPKSWAATIGLGILGSYVGGVLNWLFCRSDTITSTGILFGLLGGVICCWIWDKFRLVRIVNLKQ